MAKRSSKAAGTVKKRAADKAHTKRPGKPYPQVTLEQALTIAQEIKAKNAGNPWATEDVAAAVGRSAKTMSFIISQLLRATLV